MKKLSALTSHMLTLSGITRDQVEAFTDQGRLISDGKDLGYGLQVGRFKYDAVISIDRCRAEIAEQLLSSLLIWLDANDPERDVLELAEPDVDVTPLDDQTVGVEIVVAFDEPLVIVPDPEGPLAYEGEQWRVGDAGVTVAETLAGIETV
ncbi:phage tail protein [Desulfoluna spongiiphila]|uniref:P2 phage tail completion protein R (GpR) n=1 Tax=Desulfoluna spongiiphila TaxID=419481 RepID=A0A1G5G3Z5_9BACT|nr:phage tail protein [Desulfoluna spongiiphila]SCY46057.1 P2 phage tail completion protein R (GpR) [Desulfoluna spongiiphila]